jgi:hypothetical protein
MMKKILPVAVIVGLAYFALDKSSVDGYIDTQVGVSDAVIAGASDSSMAEAYESRSSGLQVEGTGEVIRILPDDVDGDRHQRFILRLRSGQTLLIAHNIDLAPRLSDLDEGDTVAFFGEYEWNDQGGVIHWTHRDPRGQHTAGWLRHEGRTFQ